MGHRPAPEGVCRAGPGGEITGSVLDIGCGTGEHALFFAEEGHEVWGIDASPRAIQKAGEKAAERGLRVNFLVMNALLSTRLVGHLIRPRIRGSFIHSLTRTGRSL